MRLPSASPSPYPTPSVFERVRGFSTRPLATAVSFAILAAALTAGAESALLLEIPNELEGVSATTFSEDGRPVGESALEVEADEAGVHRMKIELAIAGGGISLSEATLSRVAGVVVEGKASTEGLRLLEQRSQATRADGVSLDLLVIDHERGRVSCYANAEPPEEGRHLAIEGYDRVVNVPLQLLFQPLARGDVNDVRFQIAACRGKPVLHDIVARRAPMPRPGEHDVIEIRYGPDVSGAVSWLAGRLLPSFSFWFDGQAGRYLGHRMPLHRKGPEILLVRQGLTPPDLGQ